MLTSILYVLFAVLTWRSFLTMPVEPARPEIIAKLLPDPAEKKAARLPPPPIPFIAHKIRPRAEDMAAPRFTVQPESAPTQATLPVTAVTAPSPLAGGEQSRDASSLPASATGSNGNAGSATGCLDADWVRAVNARLLRTFHYPRRAEILGITGEVHLRFTVEGDGFFSALKIDKASGSYSLDSNAIAMMRNAQPLPAIPPRMHVTRVDGMLVLLFGQKSAGIVAPLLTCG